MKKLLSLIIISSSMIMSYGMVDSNNKEQHDIVGTKIPCIYSRTKLGSIELYHNQDGFLVKHGEEYKEIHPGFVDRVVRDMGTEQLGLFLGLNKPEITIITRDQFEEEYSGIDFPICEISEPEKEELISQFGGGYLRLEQMSDGEFTLKAFSGGLGGGPVTGVVVGVGIKAVGYTTIALCGGPVGWGVVAYSLGETLLSGCVSSAFKWICGGDKLAKATKNAHKAQKELAQAKKTMDALQKIVLKNNSPKAAKQLAKSVANYENMKRMAGNAAKKVAAITASAGAEYGVTFKEGVNTVQTGVDAAGAVKKAGKAAFVPTAALVDGVADVCQFLCEFLPTP